MTDDLVNGIRRALAELGVPGEGYPAPVANAIAILEETLAAEVDHSELGDG